MPGNSLLSHCFSLPVQPGVAQAQNDRDEAKDRHGYVLAVPLHQEVAGEQPHGDSGDQQGADPQPIRPTGLSRTIASKPPTRKGKVKGKESHEQQKQIARLHRHQDR